MPLFFRTLRTILKSATTGVWNRRSTARSRRAAHEKWESELFLLKRALGMVSRDQGLDAPAEVPTLADVDEFPDDPTTETVPKPISQDGVVENPSHN